MNEREIGDVGGSIRPPLIVTGLAIHGGVLNGIADRRWRVIDPLDCKTLAVDEEFPAANSNLSRSRKKKGDQ